jgi:hypothetical protein
MADDAINTNTINSNTINSNSINSNVMINTKTDKNNYNDDVIKMIPEITGIEVDDELEEILLDYLKKYKKIYSKQFDIKEFFEDKKIFNFNKEFKSSVKCSYCNTYNNLIRSQQILCGDEIESVFLICYNKECEKFNIEQDLTMGK